MKIFLAPMEGLTDYYMRDMLTQIGQYDACVTEFLRVTDRLLPEKTFYRACPELHHGAKTRSGTPVHFQLLGSDPSLLAESAAQAVKLGAPLIDLNFGCPAKTVNRHRGGAALLDEPELLFSIVQAVRKALPPSIPVTAKMRLGIKDQSRMIENAQAFEQAGASSITVHARTKEAGYRPPADWEALAKIREAIAISLMANGEVWTVQDAQQCLAVSGCQDLMLGRGAISNPQLVNSVRNQIQDAMSWLALLTWQKHFLCTMFSVHKNTEQANYLTEWGAEWTESGAIGRYKQWLGMLTRDRPEAMQLFLRIKKLKSLNEIVLLLDQVLQQQNN